MSSFKEILEFTENLVHTTKDEHLNDLQRTILKECWQNSKKTYDRIAVEYDYSANYIKQGVGPKLWRLLSEVTGEKITKGNFRSVLERQYASCNSSILEDRKNQKKSENILDSNSVVNSKEETNKLTLSTLESPIDNVPLNSPFYIERIPHEAQCYAEILQAGAFIRIKAPRQMGKSSLMYRILDFAKQKNNRATLIHFQQADSSILGNLDRFLRWFCANLVKQLNLTLELEECWDDILGAKMNCTAYLQTHILNRLNLPLVIALEEVNEIIKYPQVAKEFLTLLRFWHEKTKNDPAWQKLKLIMVHSTEIYIPLDINQSPLNVGLKIELKPFSKTQILDLVMRHRIALSDRELEQLNNLAGGFPYLTRKALYHLVQQQITFERLIATAPTDSGIYSNHLQRHLRNLESDPELIKAMMVVLESPEPIEIEQIAGFKLHSMGLIKYHGSQVSVSCNLYQKYFGDLLLKS